MNEINRSMVNKKLYLAEYFRLLTKAENYAQSKTIQNIYSKKITNSYIECSM